MINFEKLVKDEFAKHDVNKVVADATPHDDVKAIDYAAILAILIPILIDLMVKYVIPFLIKTVIPWIIDAMKKKDSPLMALAKRFSPLSSLLKKFAI
jgi:hypothetical protein